jgi:hypothetical protein
MTLKSEGHGKAGVDHGYWRTGWVLSDRTASKIRSHGISGAQVVSTQADDHLHHDWHVSNISSAIEFNGWLQFTSCNLQVQPDEI